MGKWEMDMWFPGPGKLSPVWWNHTHVAPCAVCKQLADEEGKD